MAIIVPDTPDLSHIMAVTTVVPTERTWKVDSHFVELLGDLWHKERDAYFAKKRLDRGIQKDMPRVEQQEVTCHVHLDFGFTEMVLLQASFPDAEEGEERDVYLVTYRQELRPYRPTDNSLVLTGHLDDYEGLAMYAASTLLLPHIRLPRR